MSKTYRVERGSLHDRFQRSRAKIQMFAGGFGNGKTTGAVIKALNLARDYPGSNGLVARSTYPKLSQTIRKEFNTWTPKNWQQRNVDSKDNLIQLTNGSIINFSHVQQTGKSAESSTSNLLSATYDWIVFDQIEDPEVTHKDFTDLLGRLRGQTPYNPEGNFDETMPSSGPRWFIIMCNPTRNWVYQKLVKPVHDLKNGIHNPDLMVDEETGEVMIEIFEGSTYDNAANLPADFITTLQSTYKGQMKDRFLKGEWGAYEGLVYPDYDPAVHMVDHDLMLNYYNELVRFGGATNNILETYDHGIAKPACYMFCFTDLAGNVFVLDGFYEKEQSISQLSKRIRQIRLSYGFGSGILTPGFMSADDFKIMADPAIFRRVSGDKMTVGRTTAGLFREEGLKMIRGNNDVLNGIAKVQSYLYIDPYHSHPLLTDATGKPIRKAPRIFFSKDLTFIDQEIVDYYWRKDTSGEYEDMPMDRNDHAMDALKYLLTNKPRVATIRPGSQPPSIPSQYRQWREAPDQMQHMRSPRHG